MATTSEKTPRKAAANDAPRALSPVVRIAAPPALSDDPEYAKASAAAARVSARLADLRARREEAAEKVAASLGARRPPARDVEALAVLAADGAFDDIAVDGAALAEVKSLDAEIATRERATEIAAERLRDVERFAARRLGAKYGAALAPLRAEAIGKLVAAHDALAALSAAYSAGEAAQLSVPVLGIAPSAASHLFQIVADLKEHAGYAAAGGAPVPEAGR